MTFHSDEQSAELRDLFFESAAEILQGMNEAGLALEKGPADPERLREVRRAVHTLKGDSAACGFRDFSELAHQLEEVLTPTLAQEKGGLVAEIVLAATDTFYEMLAACRTGADCKAAETLRQNIQRLLAEPAPASSVAPAPVKNAKQAPARWTEYERLLIAETLRNGESVYNVTLQIQSDLPLWAAAYQLALKGLESAGKVLAMRPESAAAVEKSSTIEAALASTKPVEWIRNRCRIPSVVSDVQVERITQGATASRDLLEILLESEAAAIASGVPPEVASSALGQTEHSDAREASGVGSSAQTTSENILRVDAGRVDAVMNLIGELIIAKSMLQRAIDEFDTRHAKDPLRAAFVDLLSFQNRVLGELQKSVMKIRMVPADQLFRRFPRIVRDVAKQRGKAIALEIAGQNTDLDKSILDAIAEPLAHLIRNAADHGIESCEERLKGGKPERGTVSLDAYQDGDQVVIEVTDDGAGIDRAKLVRRVVNDGLMQAEDAARLSDVEALQLVFLPGLSTADEITEISGRGVGLDVVKTSIEKLKGSIEIDSERGKGTTFRLVLPLTLASIQTLLFRSHGRLYAIPLASVSEISRLADADIHMVDGREVFELRGQVLTLIRLDSLGPRLLEDRPKRVFVIIIQIAGRRIGLAVDRLVGEQELVIKALEDRLVTSPLVSGASILGDGTVVMILNVPALVSQLSRLPTLGATA